MSSSNKYIISGPPVESSIDVCLGELFLMMLKVHGDKIVQIDAATGQKLSATLLLNKAILLAKWFRENNLRPGDCVSIMSENHLDFIVVPVAVCLAGITLAPINPSYTKHELRHCVNLSKPQLIFCTPKTYQLVLSEKAKLPYLSKIVLFGRERVRRKDVIMYQDIVKGAREDEVDESFEPTIVDPEESVFVILCSSGTTGLPKGVMTTHRNFSILLETLRIVYQENSGTVEIEERIVTGIAPFFHGFGFMTSLLGCLSGSTIVVYDGFKPKLFLESISKYKITSIAVPPPIIVFLVKHPMVKKYDLSSVLEIRSGAAPLGKELQVAVGKDFKTNNVGQSYGMTESTLTILAPWGDCIRKPGSVGKVVPGMEVKIIDESNNSLGSNQVGELCFRGPLIMKGYIGNPEATAEVIDKEKWLHTGDVGYYDDDGVFFIVDRLKELIKYKGFQVAPAELEALLMSHSSVADAAVIGIEDELVGELPLAFVVKKPSSKVTATELQDFVAERVSSAKQLRGGVHFIKEIPKNPTGKILRRVLKKSAKTLRSKL